jgi:hypothetical protein
MPDVKLTQNMPKMNVNGYEVAVYIKAGVGEPAIKLGRAGVCRFCGEAELAKFRKKAHAIPEALGNKWVESLDECDTCNGAFGTYEDALAKSIGIVLTVGGTLGKGNKVRQTGRTSGPAVTQHTRKDDGRRAISMRANGTSGGQAFYGTNGSLVLVQPSGTERFRPIDAFKALVKVALAIMPDDELHNFQRMRNWLLEPESQSLPNMLVGVSFGSVGNAPPLLTATLLRRTNPQAYSPYMLFVLTAGSICFQIFLKADSLDGDWPPRLQTRPSISWTTVIGPSDAKKIEIKYGPPTHYDWSDRELKLSIIESITTTFDPKTTNGWIVPSLCDPEKWAATLSITETPR